MTIASSDSNPGNAQPLETTSCDSVVVPLAESATYAQELTVDSNRNRRFSLEHLFKFRRRTRATNYVLFGFNTLCLLSSTVSADT